MPQPVGRADDDRHIDGADPRGIDDDVNRDAASGNQPVDKVVDRDGAS